MPEAGCEGPMGNSFLGIPLIISLAVRGYDTNDVARGIVLAHKEVSRSVGGVAIDPCTTHLRGRGPDYLCAMTSSILRLIKYSGRRYTEKPPVW